MIVLLSVLTLTSALPIAENDLSDLTSNYLPKFRYSTSIDHNFENDLVLNDIETPKTTASVIDMVKEGTMAGIDLLKEFLFNNSTNNATEIISIKLDPNYDNFTDFNETSNRQPRQEEETTASAEKVESIESEEQSEEQSEEDENMITGLISAFLGGLSKPDGGVDVEAITGLLGSLSTQNDDGSYDFSGLTELLKGFFGGGDEDGGGGSDFGAFFGGLIGAFIKGVANPPGAKGAGVFAGRLLGGVLPALSGPAATEGNEKPSQGLDSGGFLSGLISSIFGSSGGGSSNSAGDGGGGSGSKFSFIKAIFSIISSIFSTSSTSH